MSSEIKTLIKEINYVLKQKGVRIAVMKAISKKFATWYKLKLEMLITNIIITLLRIKGTPIIYVRL